MSRRVLCRLTDLADTGCRGFADVDAEHGVFVVRQDDAVYGYRNRCPHTGAPLEWQPNHFLDIDGRFIQCALHGALFRVSDGLCLRGPCAGRSLQPVDARVEQGLVVLYQE